MFICIKYRFRTSNLIGLMLKHRRYMKQKPPILILIKPKRKPLVYKAII